MPVTRGAPPLFVEPNVVEAPVVVNRILVLHMTLEVGVPSRRSMIMKDDGPCHILDKDAFDPPDEGLALFGVGLLRLLIKQSLDLRIAVLRSEERRVGKEDGS